MTATMIAQSALSQASTATGVRELAAAAAGCRIAARAVTGTLKAELLSASMKADNAATAILEARYNAPVMLA